MKYNLAVIGGGPAGYSAALEAAKYGLSVILFEGNVIGGTCLNKGCVPTKYLAHTAEQFNQIKSASKYGISLENLKINYSVAVDRKDKLVSELRNELIQSLTQNKIEIIHGFAEVIDKNHISCNDVSYTVQNILIATGSIPSEPVISNTISTDELLQITEIPSSIKIIGGGVTAVEFADIFSKLGAEITLSIRGERILNGWDKELAVAVTQMLKKHGVKILPKCSPKDFSEGEYSVTLSAVGRRANLMGLDNLNLQLGNDGGICIDESGKTNYDNIYAAGDVVSSSPKLAHVGMEQGRKIVQHIVGSSPSKKSAIVNCIYTDPEVASVGMTEKEAKEKGVEFSSGKINLHSNARTLIETDDRCFIKILAEKKTHRILGAQLLCKRASDIASEFVVAINNDMTVEQMLQSIHPHPSFSEAITDVLNILSLKLNEL